MNNFDNPVNVAIAAATVITAYRAVKQINRTRQAHKLYDAAEKFHDDVKARTYSHVTPDYDLNVQVLSTVRES
ncbi:MAG: hypothetical protein LC687_03160 [Actinobacteria bacterium]|nr:hypothetical protein [Actinomycetota bacterium]